MRHSTFGSSQNSHSNHVPRHSAVSGPGTSPTQATGSSMHIGTMFGRSGTSAEDKLERTLPQCSACEKAINERFIMKVVGKFWHQECLICSSCGCELTTSLFEKNGAFFCKEDYLRKFGPENQCSGCSGMISASELVMRSSILVYHIRCFCCSHCRKRLNPGDRYVVSGDQLLCETDYEGALLSSKLSYYFSTLEPANGSKERATAAASSNSN